MILPLVVVCFRCGPDLDKDPVNDRKGDLTYHHHLPQPAVRKEAGFLIGCVAVPFSLGHTGVLRLMLGSVVVKVQI